MSASCRHHLTHVCRSHIIVTGMRKLLCTMTLAWGLMAAWSCGGGTVTSLQIADTKAGTGNEAGPGLRVTVHYTGWLYDPGARRPRGTRFDSSRDHNERSPAVGPWPGHPRLGRGGHRHEGRRHAHADNSCISWIRVERGAGGVSFRQMRSRLRRRAARRRVKRPRMDRVRLEPTTPSEAVARLRCAIATRFPIASSGT